MTIQVSTVSEAEDSTLKHRVDRAAYLTQLLSLRSELNQSVGWFQETRDLATATLRDLAIPSSKDEEWRFTDLSSLLQVGFESGGVETSGLSEIEKLPLSEVENLLVFVNGLHAPGLSRLGELPDGVVVGNLAQANLLQSQLSNYLAKQPGSEEVFTTLNTASFTDAAVIWVPRNQTVDVPIYLLSVAAGTEATFSNPRCLVIAESGSSLTLIEDYADSHLGNTYFANSVTEVWVGENAQVNHTRIQRDRKTAFHIGKTVVSQAQDSRYTCNAISLGARLSRHNLEVYQTEENTQTTLSGLTAIAGEQIADTHSAIAYTRPHGTSHQIHKCIVDDRAHAIFNGKIFVPKAAQFTDARQLSKNLLLSPKSRVDTKPQLEITADNVKCAHGATVSQLDSDEVFYLQSRGIDEDSARKLLVYAFAHEVINQIPVPSLQQALSRQVAIE